MTRVQKQECVVCPAVRIATGVSQSALGGGQCSVTLGWLSRGRCVMWRQPGWGAGERQASEPHFYHLEVTSVNQSPLDILVPPGIKETMQRSRATCPEHPLRAKPSGELAVVKPSPRGCCKRGWEDMYMNVRSCYTQTHLFILLSLGWWGNAFETFVLMPGT